MGEDTHSHTHDTWHRAHSTHHPETEQCNLALGQESSLLRQPSPTSTTRQLLKRKNHLNDTDETARHTVKQEKKKFGSQGKHSSSCDITKLWDEWRPPGGTCPSKAYGSGAGLLPLCCHCPAPFYFSLSHSHISQQFSAHHSKISLHSLVRV